MNRRNMILLAIFVVFGFLFLMSTSIVGCVACNSCGYDIYGRNEPLWGEKTGKYRIRQTWWSDYRYTVEYQTTSGGWISCKTTRLSGNTVPVTFESVEEAKRYIRQDWAETLVYDSLAAQEPVNIEYSPDD